MLTTLSTLLALAAAAVVVVAKPVVIRDTPVTLPLARRFNITGVPNILKQDQARAKVLKARSQGAGREGIKQASMINVDAANQETIYTVSVGAGTPPTFYDLIVDTGSSNTWVGAGKEYVQTSSSVDTGEEVRVEYGSGFFVGEQFTDTVTLGDLVIGNQGIGVAKTASGFEGVDGILGIGPVDLTVGKTSDGEAVPTVTDNAFAQGIIGSDVVGVSFEPTTELEITNGVLTFGGVDEAKFTGEINYVPITSTEPATHYVGIDQSITYGSAGTPILASTAGITDTGSTLILLASDAFTAYKAATGAVLDPSTDFLKITSEQFKNLESLFFHIGAETYELTPNAQIWPRALNTAIGGDDDSVYLIVADLGSNSGEGLDFVDGFTFLQRFYSVYDASNNVFGLATTPFTNATTN
ncbi:acid protease [Earliella scabrosa]|nr:acid protease [Earliella scabrosa]